MTFDPSAAVPAVDAAYFPGALMHAIGFDKVLRTDPGGVAVVRYVGRPEHAHSDGRVVPGGSNTAGLYHSWGGGGRPRAAGAGPASLDINVSFLERVAPGPVVVEAWVVRWGGRIAFLQAELRAEHAGTSDGGPVLARATSTGMVLRKSGG